VILGVEETEHSGSKVEVTLVGATDLSLQKVLDTQILLAYLAVYEKSQAFMDNR
jgi:hypothetical protein